MPTRFSGPVAVWVSSSLAAVRSNTAAPATPKRAKFERQPSHSARPAPIAGDSDGAKVIAIVIIAMALAERSRSKTSRTIARPSTMPAQPPQASIVRPMISIGSDQANAHTTVPTRNNPSPEISTGRRPKRSERGP